MELGDHQLGVEGATGGEGFGESGPIIGPLSTLDLNVLLEQLPSPAVEPSLDRSPLSFEPKATFALALGGNPEIRDEFAVMLGRDTKDITLV